MSEVVLCKWPIDPLQLLNRCGISIDQLTALGCKKPTSVVPNTPYLIGDNPTHAGILSQLSSLPVARGLTDLSLTLGSDNLLPLATMRDKLQEAGVGFLGAAAGLSNKRGNAFVTAVKDYQKTLLQYRKAVVANAPTKASARQVAQRAFDEMQRHFRSELSILTAQVKTRRGSPLTNPQRAINIANSSRNIAKLHVTNQVEASWLVKLTRHAKVLGNGLVVIDFGARVGRINNEYKAGGNWGRELFIESSSFATGATSGIMVGNAGAAALMFSIAATPVGWVGLVAVAGGALVAGGAAAASIVTNNATKSVAGEGYDGLMKFLGGL